MSLLILWVEIKTLIITTQAKHCKLINKQIKWQQQSSKYFTAHKNTNIPKHPNTKHPLAALSYRLFQDLAQQFLRSQRIQKRCLSRRTGAANFTPPHVPQRLLSHLPPTSCVRCALRWSSVQTPLLGWPAATLSFAPSIKFSRRSLRSLTPRSMHQPFVLLLALIRTLAQKGQHPGKEPTLPACAPIISLNPQTRQVSVVDDQC